MTCLLTWTLDRVDAGAEAQCPFCRGVYLALSDGLDTQSSPGWELFTDPQVQNPFSAARVEERRANRFPPGWSTFGLPLSPPEIVPISPSPGSSFSGHYPPAAWFQSPVLGSPEEELPATSSPESPLFPPFTPLQVEELLATSSPENQPSGNSPEYRRPLFGSPQELIPTTRSPGSSLSEYYPPAEWLQNPILGPPEEEFPTTPPLESSEERLLRFALERHAEWLRNQTLGSPEEQFSTTPSPESSLFGRSPEERDRRLRLRAAREGHAEWLRTLVSRSPEDEGSRHALQYTMQRLSSVGY